MTHKYYESRKRARDRWRRTEHGKKWIQDYMRAYRARPEVKARYHEYYVQNKQHWGGIKKAKQKNNWGGKREPKVIYKYHEEWAQKNGYRDNELLHSTNSERFTDV